jgi:hypothetical protein
MLTVKPWKKLSVCVSIDIFQLLLTVVPEFVIHDFWQPEQKHTSTELQELDRIHAQSRVEIEGWGWEGSWEREGEGPWARGRRTGPMKIGGGNPDYLTGHPLAQQPHNTTILTPQCTLHWNNTPPPPLTQVQRSGEGCPQHPNQKTQHTPIHPITSLQHNTPQYITLYTQIRGRRTSTISVP